MEKLWCQPGQTHANRHYRFTKSAYHVVPRTFTNKARPVIEWAIMFRLIGFFLLCGFGSMWAVVGYRAITNWHEEKRIREHRLRLRVVEGGVIVGRTK